MVGNIQKKTFENIYQLRSILALKSEGQSLSLISHSVYDYMLHRLRYNSFTYR